jgi:ATP-dependent RNA helicase DDX24/MAK5
LIISPTRELSMQISNVIKDIIKNIIKNYSFLKIKIATVVGGMSEDKQRRLLSTRKTPLHIIIATPGRLAEIFEDEYIDSFQDLSQIRYLVIDEADRMMEEGHFPELYRIFARFSDHDEIIRKGEKVQEVIRKRREGVPAKEEEDDEETRIRNLDDQFINPDALVDNDINEMMMNRNNMDNEDNDEDFQNEENEELEEEEVEEGEEQENDDENDELYENYGLEDAAGNNVVDNGGKRSHHYDYEDQESSVSFSLQRQTLLYTATGLETTKNKTVLSKSYLTPKQSKKLKLKGTVKGLSSDTSLPTAIKE